MLGDSSNPVALVVVAVGALGVAWANGANDNVKGVATLLGSRTTGYRGALAFATATTLAGSLAATFLAATLARRFSGAGLVPDAVVADPLFVGAVAVAAALTVLLATVAGLPISTTHALTGALVGAGLVAAGSALDLSTLGARFLAPLALGPLLAMALTVPGYLGLKRARRALGITPESCLCIGTEIVPVAHLAPAPALALLPRPDGRPVAIPAGGAAEALTVAAGTEAECVERYAGRLLGLEAQSLVDGLHFASAGAVSFARGLNDTPKIAALLVAAGALGLPLGASTTVVGLAMALGGWLGARRVARTMSERITTMNSGQGFAGNLVTAAVVIGASRLGLPVSTTHVSCGALFGIGVAGGRANLGMIAAIVVAWVATLPLAAALGAGIAAIGRAF